MPRIPFNECDGIRLRGAVSAGCKWVSQHRELLDQINYFPCADFDTGRNLFITFLSVISEMKKISYSARCDDVAKALAIGSLIGSRGNAGLIFSQFFCGFADSISHKEIIKGEDLAKALSNAAVAAKEAVIDPLEGTLLSVVSDSALAAESAFKKGSDILGVLEEAFAASKKSILKTKEINPWLSKANVVDAGGQGLVYFFEGMVRYSYRLPIREDKADIIPGEKSKDAKYCLEFVLKRSIDISGANLKELLKDISTNLIIGCGIFRFMKIHLHTNNPFLAIERCSAFGEISNIKVDDLGVSRICVE